MELADFSARESFIEETDRNFLVIAPAGVGKTTAIVNRLTQLLTSPDASNFAESIVVITYTNKAANEFQTRTLKKLKAINPTDYISLMKSVFFGTIDSFLQKRLQEFGNIIGIDPTNTRILQESTPEEEQLWHDFCLDVDSNSREILPNDLQQKLFQLVPWEGLWKAARTWTPIAVSRGEFPPFPELQLQKIFCYDTEKDKDKRNKGNLKILESWKKDFDAGYFIPIPEFSFSASKKEKFKELDNLLRREFINPVSNWIELIGGFFCNELARRYQEFRKKNGFMTFNDVRHYVYLLTEYPSILKLWRERNYRIILDEAQDTHPLNFDIFLKITPQEKSSNDNRSPRQGHFCMVGDAQQSIYSENAEDFKQFLNTCDDIITRQVVTPLIFNVTMRCPHEVIQHVNKIFAKALNGENGQAKFTPMKAKPDALEGKVHSLLLEVSEEKDYATALAKWFSQQTPATLGARHWSDIAILSRTQKDLILLKKAFSKLNIPVNFSSRDTTFGHSLLFSYLCGIFRIIENPTDSVEIISLLRELFGISDVDLFLFAQNNENFNGTPSSFQILIPTEEISTPIGQALKKLYLLRQQAIKASPSEVLKLIDRELKFCQRIFSIDPNPAEAEAIWRNLLVFAKKNEAEGIGLFDFARLCLEKFSQKNTSQNSIQDAIRLDTLHGSKGLEWPVVILPFLEKEIKKPSQNYPFLFQKQKQPCLISSKESPTKVIQKDGDDNRHRIQRLFYVGMTRAKQELFLVFSKKSPEESSVVNFLELDSEEFTKFTPKSEISPQIEKKNISTTAFSNENIDEEEISGVLEHLRHQNLKTTTPSHLEENQEEIDENNVLYGNWFHETLHFFPWKNAEKWTIYLDQALLNCPEPERGKRELQLFRDSEIPQELSKAEWKTFSEYEFFENSNNRTYNGIIDILCINRNSSHALIIDWKTEQISENDIDYTKNKYRAQLASYQRFCENYFHLTTQTKIYFSALGKLVNLD